MSAITKARLPDMDVSVQILSKTADLGHLVNVSLVDVVAEKIRTNIYTGKYQGGQKLVVRELSEEFGVSHTPVKDALNRLIAEGYVEALPRKSMVVRTFTNGELIENLQIRVMLEIFYAEEIVQQVELYPQVLAEMEEILEVMRQSIADKDSLKYEIWVENETRFHRCYMQYCGNVKAFELYKGLDTNKQTYFTYLNSSHQPLKLSTLESNLLEHRAIVDALKTQDAARLKNAVIRHLVRACDDYAVDEDSRRKIAQLKRLVEKYET